LSLSFGAGRELAAEFDSPPLARLSIMKSHLIIDIITLSRYIGTGPAGARVGYPAQEPVLGPREARARGPGMDNQGILHVHDLIASEHELFLQAIQP